MLNEALAKSVPYCGEGGVWLRCCCCCCCCPVLVVSVVAGWHNGPATVAVTVLGELELVVEPANCLLEEVAALKVLEVAALEVRF